MSWGHVILIAALMISVAALYEAFIWRGKKRPLSRHAVRQQSGKTLLGMEATDVTVMDRALKSNTRLADLNDSKWPWHKSHQRKR